MPKATSNSGRTDDNQKLAYFLKISIHYLRNVLSYAETRATDEETKAIIRNAKLTANFMSSIPEDALKYQHSENRAISITLEHLKSIAGTGFCPHMYIFLEELIASDSHKNAK